MVFYMVLFSLAPDVTSVPSSHMMAKVLECMVVCGLCIPVCTYILCLSLLQSSSFLLCCMC